MKNFIKTQKWLCLALVLILVGSFMASMFHTSFFTVNVSRVSFETERGTMTGHLYMPSGAGPDNPRPAIALVHGYLNSAEMQDLFAIELSRRGFIVLAIDLYDHGNSRWAGNPQVVAGPISENTRVWSLFDAAQFLFHQPFTARDSEGNGLIGVSGHSLGGLSAMMAVHRDEMQALESGHRMIAAALNQAADLAVLAGVPFDTMLAAFGSRPIGILAEQYCEFFFTEPHMAAEHGGPMQRVYWPATAMGRAFLGLDPQGASGISRQWETVNSGDLVLFTEEGEEFVARGAEFGLRIVYSPAIIHPWVHFSSTAASYVVEFFSTSFDWLGEFSGSGLAPQSQIWQGKAIFNLITLIGYFMLIVPVMSLLLKAPFLKRAITAKTDPVPNGNKVVFWIAFAASALFPMALYATLTERRLGNMNLLGNLLLALGLVAFLLAIWALIKQEKLPAADKSSPLYERYKTLGFGGGVFAAACVIVYLAVANHQHFFVLGRFFVAPIINTVVYWAMIVGLLTALILLAFYFLSRKALGATPANYGFAGGTVAVVASILVALIGVAVMYLVLFIFNAIFVVDGRFWTTAMRVFTFDHLLVALRYAPFYFVFFFANAVALNANTRGRKCRYLLAILLNAGGLVLWLAIQYGMLFSTGVAWYPTMNMNGVQLFAIAPYMAIAAVFACKLYEKTNNVYLAAFTNTFLFTMIPIASTAVFFNLP